MKMKKFFVVNVGLVLLLLAACGAVKPTPMPAQPTEIPPATGVEYLFVTSRLLIPTTQEQAQTFALNVDGDTQQHPDNLFGGLVTLLTSAAPNLDLQSNLDQAINTGQVVALHAVKANDPLNDPSVSWTIFQGQKAQEAPSFGGSDNFTLDSAAPANTLIVGSLTNGHFTGGPGTVRIQMFILGQLVEVNLIGVRLEADFSPQGCANGKLAGGVTIDEFRSKILPAIADGLNQYIKTDNSPPLLQTFDSDHDGTITTQELETNPLLMIAVSPDMDLLDSSGNFNPGQDGVKDSFSMGLGFTCVPASFATPAN
jgi:hypothetical protein